MELPFFRKNGVRFALMAETVEPDWYLGARVQKSLAAETARGRRAKCYHALRGERMKISLRMGLTAYSRGCGGAYDMPLDIVLESASV
jgi:hypothetical protein